MDDDRVLSELRWVILVQPVIIASEVALLRDPELDGVVLHLDEVQTRRPHHGDQQRDQDYWHRVRGGPHPEPEEEYQAIINLKYFLSYLPVEESLKLPDYCLFLW